MEDDLLLNEIIEEHLKFKNYEVTTIHNGNDAENILYNKKFDLLLLDVNVPGINGFNLLRDLRNNNIHTPAIFITSLHMIDDVEKGFLVGCDDYIKKPFELKELDLRISNINRLYKIDSEDILIIDENLSIDKKTYSLKHQ